MSSEMGHDHPWDRIAHELRACKESQRQSWGDVDNATLGRYLAGEASADEQAEVELALQALPELRKLTEIVRDVLDDVAPAPSDEPVPVEAAASAPVVLPFAPRAPAARPGRLVSFLRKHSSMIAAACLLLTCAVAMPRPGFLSAPRKAPPLTQALASTRPVPVAADAEDIAPAPPAIDLKKRSSPPAKRIALAADVSVPLAAPAAPVGPRQTAELNRQVVLYTQRGELARAVPPLSQAHSAYQSRFGENHPTTQKTARYLANFYAAALNASDPSPDPAARAPAELVRAHLLSSVPGQPVPATGASNAPQEAFFLQTASTLGAQIVRRSTQEVRKAVVPVLVQALKTTPDAQERRGLVQALAALGPVASTALPVLTERLEQSKDPLEVREILTALTRMGPAARTALPALAALSDRCQEAGKPSRIKPVARNAHSHPPQRARFTATEEKLVRKTMACLNGPDGRTGVEDQVGCLSVAAVRRSTRMLRELALKAGIEVCFETVSAAAPGKEPKQKHRGEPKLARSGRILHVLFDPQGAVVEVQVGDALQREGLTPEKLRTGLERCLRHRHADRALDESIQFVATLAAQGK
jgi:hypothetical protein